MRSIRSGLFGVASLLLGLAAHADPADQPRTKFYVGVDLGYTRLDGAVSPGFFETPSSRPDGRDTGFKALAGIQISRYFAVEAGYTDFGRFTARDVQYSCPVGATPPCTYDVNSSTRGPSTNLVGVWPFSDRWSLKARFGAQHAEITTTQRDPEVAGSTLRNQERSWGFMYGAGLSYKINPHWSASLDWERNDQLSLGLALSGGAGVFELGSSSLTSLGVAYRF